MKIEGISLTKEMILSPVSYKPFPDCSTDQMEIGVIIDWNDSFVKVLYCKSRIVQATSPSDLVWG